MSQLETTYNSQWRDVAEAILRAIENKEPCPSSTSALAIWWYFKHETAFRPSFDLVKFTLDRMRECGDIVWAGRGDIVWAGHYLVNPSSPSQWDTFYRPATTFYRPATLLEKLAVASV